MAVRDDRSDVKQTTTGFRGPLMGQSLTSAKSKFLSLDGEFEMFTYIEEWNLTKTEGDYDSDQVFKDLDFKFISIQAVLVD